MDARGGDRNWPVPLGLALRGGRKKIGPKGSRLRGIGRDQRHAGVLRLMDGFVFPQKRHFAVSTLFDLKA